MKKDGTEYLALIEHPKNTQVWCIIRWGKPAAFSDPHQKRAWVSNYFALKIKSIIRYYELSDVLELLDRERFGDGKRSD